MVGLGGASARAVYRDLLRFGPRSRRDLTRRLGLSAPTVTRVTRELLEGGHLHSLETVAPTKGRPQEPLDVEERHGPRFVGVKVTADEVHAVVTTVRGNMLEELAVPLADTAVPAVVEAVLELATALIEAHPHVAVVGISVGGVVASGRTVLSCHYLGWRDPVELADLLAACLDVPVVVENDLVAMVHGLHWFGVGRAYRSFAVLTIGAGVGSATVVDGRLIRGERDVAGLTGRFPVGTREDGSPVLLSDVASTAPLLQRARARGVLGPEESLAQLRELLAAGHAGAHALAAEVTRALAHTAAGIMALVDPQALILGGEGVDIIAAADPLFEQTLRAMLPQMQRDLVLRRLSGDFDEWARGAAVIAITAYVGAPG